MPPQSTDKIYVCLYVFILSYMYFKNIIDVNTLTEGNTAKLFGLTRRYYFRYLHEIDFGFRAQRVNLLEEAHHFQSKEIATLSKAIFERCKNLKSLTVCAARLYDATLKTICDGCPNLEVNLSFMNNIFKEFSQGDLDGRTDR